MTVWKEDGEPRPVYDEADTVVAELQYLRSRHTHEGAYDVHIDGSRLRLLPGTEKSTRARLALLLSALDDLYADRIEPIAYVAGVLALHGETNIELDGEPLFETELAEFRVVLTSTGSVKIAHAGEGKR